MTFTKKHSLQATVRLTLKYLANAYKMSQVSLSSEVGRRMSRHQTLAMFSIVLNTTTDLNYHEMGHDQCQHKRLDQVIVLSIKMFSLVLTVI